MVLRSTLTSMGDLINVLNNQGEYNDAERRNRLVLMMREKLLGKRQDG